VWTTTLEHYTRYSEAAARACAADVLLLRRAADTGSLHAIQKKYSGDKFFKVADIPAPFSL